MKEKQFRFTTDPGSALLYFGDEFVAKFNSTHRDAMTAVLADRAVKCWVCAQQMEHRGDGYVCASCDSEYRKLRAEMDAFTKHVGASSFQEARDVLIRGNAQVKKIAAERDEALKDVGTYQRRLEKALNTIDELNEAAIDDVA